MFIMEIHIGNRVADVELLGKDGNKVRLDIDGQPYEVDIVMAENGAVRSCMTDILTMPS